MKYCWKFPLSTLPLRGRKLEEGREEDREGVEEMTYSLLGVINIMSTADNFLYFSKSEDQMSTIYISPKVNLTDIHTRTYLHTYVRMYIHHRYSLGIGTVK